MLRHNHQRKLPGYLQSQDCYLWLLPWFWGRRLPPHELSLRLQRAWPMPVDRARYTELWIPAMGPRQSAGILNFHSMFWCTYHHDDNFICINHFSFCLSCRHVNAIPVILAQTVQSASVPKGSILWNSPTPTQILCTRSSLTTFRPQHGTRAICLTAPHISRSRTKTTSATCGQRTLLRCIIKLIVPLTKISGIRKRNLRSVVYA